MKIDTSLLQAVALIGATAIAIIGALQGNWNIAGMALTGFFGALNIHPKQGPNDPQS